MSKKGEKGLKCTEPDFSLWETSTNYVCEIVGKRFHIYCQLIKTEVLFYLHSVMWFIQL